jgi:hypothetical protein
MHAEVCASEATTLRATWPADLVSGSGSRRSETVVQGREFAMQAIVIEIAT